MNIEKKIEKIDGLLEERSFAMEILAELRQTTSRLWITIIVISSLWAATIGGFLWYINQYDYVSYDYTQDGEGYNNINTGNQGDVNNGAKIESQDKN